MKNTTIAAIATPVFVSSIGVIRISGSNSFNIINKIFFPLDESKNCLTAKGYTAMYGQIKENNEVIDDVVVTFFRGPLSYTGEDVVEISCHGGIYVVKKVLSLVLKSGAVLAESGEFTKRAVLNGKMTIGSAEATIDLINARDKHSAKLANYQKQGYLFQKITDVKEKILQILYHISAFIDYPEEDIEDINIDQILEQILYIKQFLQNLSNTYGLGTIIKSGVETAIVGKPNVGKSSLMNALSRDNMSIVSDIEGTTRDIIKNTIQLENIILNLNDTAGIRETDDRVEEIGKQLSFEKIKLCSLILLVFDYGKKLDKNDYTLIDSVDKDITIAVLNKSDVDREIEEDIIRDKFKYMVKISAKNSDNIYLLEDQIEEVVGINNIDLSMGIISNERHKQVIDRCISCLDNAINSIKYNFALDMISFDLEESVKILLELTGENITQSIIDGIFSKFCVGK